MGQISQFLRKSEGSLAHFCPACGETHAIAVDKISAATGSQWKWDGDIVAPTFEPSVNLESRYKDTLISRCHYTITHGIIQYLPDCTHALKGIKMPLPPLPQWLRDPSFMSIYV